MSLKTKIALFRTKQLLTEGLARYPYEGKIAKITGEPFATRLDKRYPKSQLGRRGLIKAIELSNNAQMLGHSHAFVNGKKLRGFYFRATDGSAKGVAWRSASPVYHARQLGRDVFFAHDSRVGTMVILDESKETERPRSVRHQSKGKDTTRIPVASRIYPRKPPESFLKVLKWAAEPSESVDSDECPEITEKVGTKLIQRAARGLGSGASCDDVTRELVKSGVSKQDAYLAVKAAKILIGDMMKGESKSAKLLAPLHKWPVKIEKGKTVYTLDQFKVIEKGEPAGSGLYVYELFVSGKSAGKFNNQREVVSKAQALRGK